MPMQKIVGQPCPDCGTPFIQGIKGPYCKACYIKWKNGKETSQPKVNYADKQAENISQAQDRKLHRPGVLRDVVSAAGPRRVLLEGAEPNRDRLQ